MSAPVSVAARAPSIRTSPAKAAVSPPVSVAARVPVATVSTVPSNAAVSLPDSVASRSPVAVTTASAGRNARVTAHHAVLVLSYVEVHTAGSSAPLVQYLLAMTAVHPRYVLPLASDILWFSYPTGASSPVSCKLPPPHTTTSAPPVVGVILGALGNPESTPVAVVLLTSIAVAVSTPRKTEATATSPYPVSLLVVQTTVVSGGFVTRFQYTPRFASEISDEYKSASSVYPAVLMLRFLSPLKNPVLLTATTIISSVAQVGRVTVTLVPDAAAFVAEPTLRICGGSTTAAGRTATVTADQALKALVSQSVQAAGSSAPLVHALLAAAQQAAGLLAALATLAALEYPLGAVTAASP